MSNRNQIKAMLLGNLSEKSEMVLSIAAAEAQAMKHFYIGTEHIFIGLCKVKDEALEEIFKKFGLAPGLRDEIRSRVAGGSSGAWGRELILTPRVNRLSKIAVELIKTYQLPEIEPVHLLLALLKAGDGVALRMLIEKGYNLELLQSALEDQVEKRVEEARLYPSTEMTPFLNKIGRDLTLLAHKSKLDMVVGRKKEIKKLAQILSMKKKNNPLLIGEPGVGKTAVVEGLARKLVEKDIASSLKGVRIIEVSLATLVAGTKYRGDFENRVLKLVEESRRNKDVILFIDEIHNIIGAGSAMGAMDAANILKPALASGDIRCIGATTLAEYRQYIEKDAALERRFHPVLIEEPSREEALEIIEGLKATYETYYAVKITTQALHAAVDFSIRYIRDRRLPDKAIDLIDQSLAKKKLMTLTTKEYEEPREIVEEDIAEVVSEWTGIPVKKLTEGEKEKLLAMEDALSKVVIGQQKVINAVANAIRAAKAGLGNPTRPLCVFLLLGPTGVGKTELARATAEFLFNDPKSLIQFDMSEYMEQNSVSKLIGAPPGYIGYEQEGVLTGAVRQLPFSVLLFDEIEKAHPSVFDLFLQVFDEGRLTDSKGKQVDFTNTIIIMTSNIASSLGKKPAIGFKGTGVIDLESEAETKALNNLLREKFREEFLNRIDKKIVFNFLGQEEIRLIIDKFLKDLENRLSERQLSLHLDDEVYDLLMARGYSEQYGAREMQRVIQHEIVEPFATVLLKDKFKSGDTVYISVQGSKMEFMTADELKTK